MGRIPPHEISFGFGLGKIHHVLSARQRERIVLTAYDSGCRHFDAAAAYGDGLCEAELGRILRTRRASVRLATKFGIPAPSLGGRNIPLYFAGKGMRKLFSRSYGSEYALRDFSPNVAVKSVEESLRRLRTDHIDILFFHEPRDVDDLRAMASSIETLERLKREGKVGRYGVSATTRILLEQAGLQGFVGDAVQFELAGDARQLVEQADDRCFLSAFGIMRHLNADNPDRRLDYGEVLAWFFREYPGVLPILASNRPGEIEKLGKAFAGLIRPVAPTPPHAVQPLPL